MKRRFAGTLVGALVAGSIGVAAAPAHAQGCTLGPPPQEELVSISGPIQIYAGRVPGYALAVAGWAADYADCRATVLVNCLGQAGPTLPLVEVDTNTLTVTIHPDNVVGDTSCIHPPQ